MAENGRAKGRNVGMRPGFRTGRGKKIYVTIVHKVPADTPDAETPISPPPVPTPIPVQKPEVLLYSDVSGPSCPYEYNGMVYYGSQADSSSFHPSTCRSSQRRSAKRTKKVLKIEEPGPDYEKPKKKITEEELDAAAGQVLFDPYLLVKILNHVTSMNDRKNVELTCQFFKEVSRGTLFQPGYYGKIIECCFMDFQPTLTCQGPGEETFIMLAATKELNPDAMSQPNGVTNLKHFFDRFSRQTMSVIFGGTPAEFAPYVKNHTVLLTKDLVECFSELHKLKHLCLRNVFIGAHAAAHLKNNLIVKNCLVALCLHNISFAGGATHNFVAIATGRYLKRLTIDDPLIFVWLMHFLNSPKFADVIIDTVSIYCNKNITKFYNDVLYVEKIASKHINKLHFSVNFFGVRKWDEFKRFKTFLDNTTLNIESLDIRIYFTCDKPHSTPNFPVEELFSGLSRHTNLKKFCLSGKLDIQYAPVISRALEELSKLKLLNTVVLHQALKLFDENFWTHAVQNIPMSIEHLAISSAHYFTDGHAQILMQRLEKLKKFKLEGTKKFHKNGARYVLNSSSLTHVELTNMPSVSKFFARLLNECSPNLKAIIAGMKEHQLKGDMKQKLEDRFEVFDYYEMAEECKFFYKMATSEGELKSLKDISKFFYCEQCNADILTDQCC